MAKTPKQQFVQARLKATGKEATPEQRAKFRQRFDVLSGTKEGRTRIAQVVLPAGDAKSRAALKKSLVPQKSTTGTTGTTGSTGGTTSSTGKSTGGTTGGTTNSTGKSTSTTTSATSTTLPNTTTSTTLPNTTTSTTMAKNNTSNSSAVIPAPVKTASDIMGGFAPISNTASAKKTSNFLNDPNGLVTKALKGMPGTQAYRDKPGYSLTNLPLGIGRVIKGVKDINNEKYLSGAGNVFAGVAEFGVSLASARGGKTNTKSPYGGSTPYMEMDYKISQAVKAQIRGIEDSFIGPKLRPSFGTVAEQRAANPPPGNKDFRFPSITEQRATNPVQLSKLRANSVPVTQPPVITTPPVTQPPVITTPAVTVPKPVITTPATVPSPPSTLPMTYDSAGNRLNRTGPDEGYLTLRPGDPKPTKPKGAPGKADSSSEQRLDYEFRLEDWNKFNPKRK